MLLGRDAELAQVAAFAQRTGVLVVTGEPGIGKTALLRAAAAAAPARVLRATGIEAESELPFAGLHELLRPVLSLTSALVPRQAQALRSALEGGATDRFAVSAAVLSLLAEAAPVLAVVDDAQWLDGASADALAFAARRLDAEGVALLVGLRAGATSPLAAPGVSTLALGPLDPVAARALAARDGRPEAVDDVVAAAAGNPLALIELAAAGGGERLVARVLGRRVAGLSPAAETAALVAALSEDEALEPALAAAAALGAGLAGWEDAEAAGVLDIEPGRVRFRHPLLRAAVPDRATPRARRAAHGALADALAERGEAQRAAWHRAAGAVAPDEAIAAALEDAAADYARRSGHLAAARALELAARLSPDASERARRLLAAAETARRAARADWARALAGEARAADPAVGAAAALLDAHVETWHGTAREALRRYLAVAAGAEPELAAIALSCAAAVAAVCGDLDAAQAAADRGAALAAEPLSDAAGLGVREALGTVLALRGRSEAARPHLDAVARHYEALAEPLGAEYVAQALLWLGEPARAGALLDAVIGAARRLGGVPVLCEALVIRADLGFRTGAWASAAADAAESVRLAEDGGQDVQLAYSLAMLAVLGAPRGDAEARDHATRAREIAELRGLRAVADQAAFALGALELAAGRPEAALERLDAIAPGEPEVLFWRADRIEAALEAGAPDAARAALAELEAGAGGAWGRGAAARARGLLASGVDDDAFAQALDLHAELPFELARSRLCYGERLRRAGRRVDARAQLRAALDGFERLGARPWAERAERELAGSGERARARRNPPPAEALTAQELQIARAIAAGATNREAGADLFLSPKTIETHLTRIYRKLGLRSRTELARALDP